VTFDARLNDLERRLGTDDAKPAPVVVYDPTSAPKDPAKREAWLRSQLPEGASVVFFIPDNERGA
jgi:hypothetical protein